MNRISSKVLWPRVAGRWVVTAFFVGTSRAVPAQTSPPNLIPTTPESTTTVAALPNATSSEPALSLDDSIRIALRNNGGIGAATQSFISARESITSVRSRLSPQVSADINSNYLNGSRTRRQVTTTPGGSTGGTTISTTSSTTTSGLSVSQNIFDGGRTRAQVRQAQARALNSVGGVGVARGNLAFEVASNFYEQLRQEKLVTQRRGQVELARQQLAQIQAQVDEGLAARVDVQPVLVNLSQARFDLATAENAFRTATTNFRNALGLGRGPTLNLQESSAAFETVAPQTPTVTEPVATEPVVPNAVGPEFPTEPNVPAPVVPVLENLEAYVAEARRLRPDLLQARASVQSGEASRSLAKIAQRPQLSASAGYDIDPRSVRDRGFQVGVGLSIPIFDAGGRKADVRAAAADLEGSQIRLAQLDKDVAADVEATYVDISGQVERIANARVLVQSARTNLATATERYRLGLGVVLDIVNAQTQLFNAQTSATQAVYDYELSRSALDRAVGRFAWADPGQPVPVAAPSQVTKTLPIATTVAPVAPVAVPGQ